MSDPIPHITAIVLAAGKGARLGGDRPKQFEPLAGKPVLRWSVERLAVDARIASVIVAIDPASRSEAAAVLDGIERLAFVDGGATRRQSVANALGKVATEFVMVHDAARPIVPVAVLDRLIAALDEGAVRGATPALPVADTLARRDDARLGDTVDRGPLVRIQTPQIFCSEALRGAHADWRGAEPTDDAQMVRAAGGEIAAVAGDEFLAKITYPGDLARMTALIAGKTRTAVGMGYDVHRLVAGEELWLGGLHIPHDRGLSGHSDADVALHALTDAILGAIGAGDIGEHFPPSDPQWRGVSSDRFLAHAVKLVAEAGGTIESLDLTIICEAPKIGPFRDAMRTRISEILRLPSDRVSVKATTTEGLGFTGRGEGIAAQALASVSILEA
ncbi:MAG: bifunctional 2-C-methyl-D-erythritol 4-phosphate cytidylyltransferase/2-C-methyl-D-erythritol 2,4-cyclodiphosphate synthase [Sphingomonadales bacterium]|nr:bifunctional 2-C-methyl-D-erythritol 4-phosphate cytidylyltransferase/2-C-methyl-D-erythritol 2,4-cyclodiphosphate synthase [Sphingomonadales bacterium]